jgi:predicted phage-related endonuclease
MNDLTETGIAPDPAIDPTPIAVDSLADYIQRLKILNGRIKDLSTEAEAIKAAIQDAMGDYELGTVHGLPAVTWTRHVRHALDQRALKEQAGDVYHAYLKATPYRRFNLVEDTND